MLVGDVMGMGRPVTLFPVILSGQIYTLVSNVEVRVVSNYRSFTLLYSFNAFAPAIRTVQQRNGMKRRITSIAFSTQRKLLKTLVAIQGITLSGNSVIGSDRVPPSETELNPQMIQQLCKGYFASLNIVTI